ncbi:MAG: DUF4093 domain-containing protein [Clostridia bacterium]|nr:DUF4093 domain-containing protein [Clostridia bacterium]
MTREKKILKYPLIVEGRYDKCTLSSLFGGLIISLDGFSVFNSKEKQALLRKVASSGIIVLTDSDGGGRQIRSFLQSMLPKDKIYNVYIPEIEGKEKRKKTRSKAGYLGVEGMKPDVLFSILEPFVVDSEIKLSDMEQISSAEFFEDGFTGGENSKEKRAALACELGLPKDMTAKSLRSAINMMCLCEEYRKFVSEHKEN